jgi:uncharacterized protein YgiM (DUF1202 family)
MARRFSSLFVVIALALASRAIAQDVPPEIENAKNSAIGTINADAVYVRSGAGDNYYPTMKLNNGTQVTVVGVKFDWLKCLPPEGSFCYVAKVYIEKGAGDTGTVNKDDVNVRAGSSLNAMKTTVQGKLSQGQSVKILGEQDEYYKIAPPPDAFVYVKKDFVNFVKAQPQVAGKPADAPQTPAGNGPAEAGPPLAQGTTTQPVGGGGPAEPIAAASTQPSAVEAQFDKLEADFTAASAKPIEQQPVAEMLGGYQKLIADPQLPESMRRIADLRTQTLKARADVREQFVALQKAQDESKKRQVALKAEQQEIEQQIKKSDVQVYAAVGTLRTSSLQAGKGVLYRLTDPQSGRTVCYIRSDDGKVAGLMEKFVGVKGQVTTDPALSLKVVAPTDIVEVDPNQLYRQIAAQIVPPSMIPQASAK